MNDIVNFLKDIDPTICIACNKIEKNYRNSIKSIFNTKHAQSKDDLLEILKMIHE